MEAPSDSGKDPQAEQQLKDLKQQYHSIQEKLQETAKMIEEQMKELSTKDKDSKESPAKQDSNLVAQRLSHTNLPKVTIRKDIKIAGQIGEKEQKGKLSYTNLMHQIDTGLQKGYPMSELVEAAVKAISQVKSQRHAR
ncbi:unnamed protein product, partial [Staurois parvus]